MIEDIIGVLAAVAVIGGTIVLVAAPARAIVMRIRTFGELPYPVLPCAALAANDLIAIAAHGIAGATDEMPKFSTVCEASVHMDGAPAAIRPADRLPHRCARFGKRTRSVCIFKWSPPARS